MFAYERMAMAALAPLGRARPTRLGRSLLARSFVRGKGVEIGAFASPTYIPAGARVRYADRVPKSHWGSIPEYRNEPIVDVDIIADAKNLDGIEHASLDFLMAFHVLEHVPETLRTLEAWLDAVRPGGHLLIAVPDRRFTRDAARPTTPMEHFMRDYKEGPEWGTEEHHHDIAKNVEGLTDEKAIEQYVIEHKADEAPHFHVWDLDSYIEFLAMARDFLHNRFELLSVGLNHEEDICALRVLGNGGGLASRPPDV